MDRWLDGHRVGRARSSRVRPSIGQVIQIRPGHGAIGVIGNSMVGHGQCRPGHAERREEKNAAHMSFFAFVSSS